MGKVLRSIFVLGLAAGALSGCSEIIEWAPPTFFVAEGAGPGLGGDAVVLVALATGGDGSRHQIMSISVDGRSWRNPDYVPTPADSSEVDCVSCPRYPRAEIP